MNRQVLAFLAFWLLAAAAVPSAARSMAPDPAAEMASSAAESAALPYIQCVPYARRVSGIRLYGDAHTWWDQAAGRYARGTRPKVGAVMAFRPHGAMQLGHVAAISRIVDSRTVLLRHANWSLIGGRRGQTEDNVRAVDVSPANDWSEVRVWFAPLADLGTTRWPVEGFIYNQKPQGSEMLSERLTVLASAQAPKAAYMSRIGPDFLKGIAPETGRTVIRRAAEIREAPRPAARPRDSVQAMAGSRARLLHDPIGRIIASRL